MDNQQTQTAKPISPIAAIRMITGVFEGLHPDDVDRVLGAIAVLTTPGRVVTTHTQERPAHHVSPEVGETSYEAPPTIDVLRDATEPYTIPAAEAAKKIGISARGVYVAKAHGRLTAERRGGLLYFRKSEVNAYRARKRS